MYLYACVTYDYMAFVYIVRIFARTAKLFECSYKIILKTSTTVLSASWCSLYFFHRFLCHVPFSDSLYLFGLNVKSKMTLSHSVELCDILNQMDNLEVFSLLRNETGRRKDPLKYEIYKTLVFIKLTKLSNNNSNRNHS